MTLKTLPLCIFLLLAMLSDRAWAQTYAAQDLSVGLFTVSSQDAGSDGEHLSSGPSGTYDYNLSPRVSLGANLAWIAGFQQGEYADEGHELLFTAGIKAGWQYRRWGLFARVAPGLASFDHGLGIAQYPATSFTLYPRTHFALEEGAVVEYYPTRHTVVRVDAGQTLITEFDQVLLREGPATETIPGHVASHFALALSAGYRFGERQEQSSPPAPSAVPKFDLGALYALHLRTHLLDQNLEPNSGAGAWGDYNFSRWGAVDIAAFYLPHDDHTRDYQDGGQAFEAYGGLKAGFRTRRFGYFAKFRPGIVQFAKTLEEEDITPTAISLRIDKFTNLAFDAGGVIEFYPSRHLVLRIDMGEDVLLYRARTVVVSGSPASIPGLAASSFLFLTGAGWRF
jgi:Outer membrane protein beta-barrel domain